MGCTYPIKIKNENYNVFSNNYRTWNRQKYYYIPCGKCLNCRIAKTEWLYTACEYEYNKFGIGSFTTLTYDNENYEKLWNKENSRIEPNYKDFRDFINRLRQNLYRKYGFRKEFKYLVTCEIGSKNERLHYHVLFFGLDYKNNDLDIYNSWNMGLVQNLPIKNGAIRYVLKYLTKDVVGFREKYGIGKDNHMFKYSLGLGSGFIDENIDFIIKNNGCYDRGDGKLRSLPSYWLNKLMIKPIENLEPIRREMEQAKIKKSGLVYSKSEIMRYRKEKLQLKERMMINESRSNRNAQDDFNEFESNSMWEEKIFNDTYK